MYLIRMNYAILSELENRQSIFSLTYDWGIWWKAEPVYQYAMKPKTLDLTAQRMFEKEVKAKKIHDLNA